MIGHEITHGFDDQGISSNTFIYSFQPYIMSRHNHYTDKNMSWVYECFCLGSFLLICRYCMIFLSSHALVAYLSFYIIHSLSISEGRDIKICLCRETMIIYEEIYINARSDVILLRRAVPLPFSADVFVQIA